MTDEDIARASDRADFLKRFFAVAVSVGFASQVGQSFEFILKSRIPTVENASHVALLTFAMLVIVGSWDYYFAEIRANPIIDRRRFVLDIFIVTLYILLLFSTNDFRPFSVILILIMLCYVVWDILSIWAQPTRFGVNGFSIGNVLSVYLTGFRSDEEILRRPYVTLYWAILTSIIIALNRFVEAPSWACGVLLAVGYLLYRRDQVNPISPWIRFGLSLSFIVIALATAIPSVKASVAPYLKGPFTMSAALDNVKTDGGMLYVAGPYTHTDPKVREHRFLDATIVAARLIERGFIVYSPLTMTHPIDLQLAKDGETMGSDYWVKFDEAFMAHCSAILVLKSPGWEQSSGVKREIAYFEAAGRPVIYAEPAEFGLGASI